MGTKNCIVCLLPIGPNDETIDCPNCGGIAHRREMLEWVKTKGKCPFCKIRLSINQLIKVIKVSFVGFGGAGKTTLLKLLFDEEVPVKHIPTLMVSIKNLEGVEIPIKVIVWDFAGQERFGRFWNVMIRGSDIVIVVTDSSVTSVARTKKRIISLIQEHVPDAKVVAIANKQDLPHSLDSELVGRLLDVPTYGTVAIDPSTRDVLFDMFKELLGS